jgi:protoporphyrinogen oxidase
MQLWGQTVDVGPHRFFSSDNRVNKIWLENVNSNYRTVNRLTRIFYKGRFFLYPLSALNALKQLGVFEAGLCVLSYLRQKVAPIADDHTFESWVVRRFGFRLYRTFFKTYSEKLWGISCRDLDSDFAAQRIKKLSLWEAIKNALSVNKKSGHKTLVDEFAYPVGGSGAPYERMVEFVKKSGGNFYPSTPIKRVVTRDETVTGIELMNGEFRAYDRVISTMPMDLLVKGLDGVPAAIKESMSELVFRNTIVVFLRVEGADHFPDNWLYIHAPDLQTGRITNFRNWIPENCGDSPDTILACEYWCYDSDALWSASDADLIKLATQEAARTTLIGKARVLDGHVTKIKRCYPVYSTGYKKYLEPVVAYLRRIKGLQVIGRYGSFKYNNQDHSILMGYLAAENLISGTRNDLWEINTDYENYQEKSEITATGLEPVGAH